MVLLKDDNKNYSKQIYEDDLYIVAKALDESKTHQTYSRWTNSKATKRKFTNLLFVGDENPIFRVSTEAIDKYKPRKFSSYSALGVGFDFVGTNVKKIDLSKDFASITNFAVFFSVDCKNISTSEQWLSTVDKAFKEIGKEKGVCIVSVILPDIPNLPEGIGSLAEREFEAFLKLRSSLTPEQAYFLEIENLCKKATKLYGTKVILLRIPYLFSLNSSKIGEWDVKSFFTQVIKDKEVVVKSEDLSLKQSITYVVDAVCVQFEMLYNGMPGNIYNYASYDTTFAELKLLLQNKFLTHYSLKVEPNYNNCSNCRCLSILKIKQVETTKYRSLGLFQRQQVEIEKNARFCLENIIVRFFCFISETKYDNSINYKIYSGKLNKIKELEMEMLREVDRICEKYNLKYFLAAGTLLGAKRYGHNIPWDDDLDIAFLRNDFEKFRKIVQEELSNKFEYCCYFNETKSHYLVDKIRVKDTWFSTKYSSINKMPDGVFLDILVYDATSDFKCIAWCHNKIVQIFQIIICKILWCRLKRRDFSSSIVYGVYRLLTIIPIRCWHSFFEIVLKAFRRKKAPKYLIDGLGARAGIKLIPSKGLFDTTRVHFDGGFMAPSPKDPEGYLQFAYGKNYLEEPPISEQHGHPLSRIDLGEMLFNNLKSKTNIIHPVDLRGELFEL